MYVKSQDLVVGDQIALDGEWCKIRIYRKQERDNDHIYLTCEHIEEFVTEVDALWRVRPDSETRVVYSYYNPFLPDC